MIKAILVDMDGTLIFTDEVNFEAYKYAFNSKGIAFNNSDFESTIGKTWSEFIPRISGINDPKIHKEIHLIKKEKYKSLLHKATINQPLLDLLELSKPKCKLALVTSASKENTFDILNFFKLTEIFNIIITRDDIKKPKPDPEGYLKAMNFLKVSPQETIIFEDSSTGVESGLKSKAMTWKLC